MIDAVRTPIAPVSVGLILFDDSHCRVFAIRGTAIEDAREFAADVGRSTSRGRRPSVPLRSRTDEQIQDRAGQAVVLVSQLHACRPFDCLLVAGPPRARALLWQCLPPSLRVRLAGSVGLDVAAGESTILNVVLPAVNSVVQRSARAAQRIIATTGTAVGQATLAGTHGCPAPRLSCDLRSSNHNTQHDRTSQQRLGSPVQAPTKRTGRQPCASTPSGTQPPVTRKRSTAADAGNVLEPSGVHWR